MPKLRYLLYQFNLLYNIPMPSPIIFTFTSKSNTVGVISALNDGTINLPQINIDDNTFNISLLVVICRMILKSAGNSTAVKKYKLQIKRGSKVLMYVPSVYYGSKLTQDEYLSDYEILKGRTLYGTML